MKSDAEISEQSNSVIYNANSYWFKCSTLSCLNSQSNARSIQCCLDNFFQWSKVVLIMSETVLMIHSLKLSQQLSQRPEAVLMIMSKARNCLDNYFNCMKMSLTPRDISLIQNYETNCNNSNLYIHFEVNETCNTQNLI